LASARWVALEAEFKLMATVMFELKVMMISGTNSSHNTHTEQGIAQDRALNKTAILNGRPEGQQPFLVFRGFYKDLLGRGVSPMQRMERRKGGQAMV
jgi:hypothetical protein